MPKSLGIAVLSLFCMASIVCAERAEQRISVRDYRDKMEGGWIGQMIGVSWGAPTELKFRQIMPTSKMPPFKDTLINEAFPQDDLYVEMTFLRTLEEYGLDVPWRQAAIDFANSEYELWIANREGRLNLRNGIAPPDCSHPCFHASAGAIDYQIEADYAGLIAPGMLNLPIELGNKFGRLMNFGDGLYAGQFIGGMYAEAFFEQDIVKVIEAGLRCIPAEAQYAEMVRDVLAWHRENPTDWQDTWRLVDQKYRQPNYWHSPLDVKLEGAYVLIGMLYGEKDPDKTIIISTRCGDDSDCNPSSAAGVLGTMLGKSRLPTRYYEKLALNTKFTYTPYTYPELIDVCDKLTRQAVLRSGGRIEKDASGEEFFVIPTKPAVPNVFENIREPGPVAESRFTPEEMAKIKKKEPVSIIFDTDMGNDIDDALALAMIHALQNRGECRLLAVTLTNDNPYAAPFIDLVNTFFGHGEIPIGVVHDGVKLQCPQNQDVPANGDFVATVCKAQDDNSPRYAHKLQNSSDAPKAVSLLRKTLAAQPDKSVVLVQVGFSTNLARLLDSKPDDVSPLNGVQLVSQKARLLSMMGGKFSADPEPFKEFNIVNDLNSARKVFEQWPTPIVASGFEIGESVLFPATSIEQDYDYVTHHPIAEAYRSYQKMPHDRPTWDLTSVLFAVRPNAGYFGLSPQGRIVVEADGVTRFEVTSNGPHRYLTLTKDQSAKTLETIVELCRQPPTSTK